ncbi:MAG: EAL domain-containing protein [Acetobacteraceae bacterium]|jgi:diguanylate cyclase (GGDEF)-like protein
MINSTRGAGARQRIHGIFSGRLPFVIVFGCILLVNWGAALWLIHYTYQERELAAYQMVTAEAQYSQQKIEDLFKDADRTLMELRARYSADHADLGLQRWNPTLHPGGIALIAPDGQILATTPGANVAGWPNLMTRLEAAADVLAIGEPIPGKNGHLGFVPVARRIVAPDGSFGGILMYSLETSQLSSLSPAIKGLNGCVTLVTDDGVILARTPEVRGTVGIRMMPADLSALRESRSGTGRHVSLIDGVDRIFSFQHLADLPVTLIVGIGHDAIFTDWKTLRFTVITGRMLATAFILVISIFWYKRRHRATISGDALTAILTSIDTGIRVENRDGVVLAANETGADLRMPDRESQQADVQRPDGRIIQLERRDLADGGTVLIGTDVTARHAAEERIEFLTSHDSLTGLPNRWRAATRIQELLTGKFGSARVAALILFDLDGFQDVNDTLGHEGGDTILIEIAHRLRDLVSGRDVVARLGGDEFLLFLDDPGDDATIMSLARQLPRSLARPIAVRAQQVRLGASLGIALYPRDGEDVTTLFRHANIALSRAKMAGRGTAQSFDPEMMIAFEEHRMVESDLRRALDSDELELRLQPQFSCDTLEVTGFEALTRWRHPTRGMLSPAVFIPIAERSGLINPLGLWAIEQACKAAITWPTRHRVAVNLSPSQLRCETIQDDIRAILRRTQFPAHLLELEVTESVLLDQDQRTLETLHKLRAMDIRVTLDDFGTGYSSLSYLRRFPFDKIKIDKSFIQGQGSDRSTKVILEAMIRMCTDLGLDVVVEGVETELQLHELRQLGCREIQGFLLGEPLLPAMIESFLTVHGRRSGTEPLQDAAAANT